MRRSVIIAGFHRSGTSLTSQLLHRSGLFLGYKLLGAAYSNVYGHAEDTEILRLHDAILADNGLTWQVDRPVLPEVHEAHRQQMQQIVDKREAEHKVWGFKDPRVCLFLNAWKSLLPDTKVLIVYRSPVQSSFSLHKRAAAGLLSGRGDQQYHRKFREVPDLSLKMWLSYNNRLIDFTHSYPEDVLVLSFDMLRGDFPLISLLNQQWELGLEEIATSEVFDPNVTAESGHRQPVANTELIVEALGTWEALEALSKETEKLLGATALRNRPLTEECFRSAEDTYDVLIESEFRSHTVEFLQARTRELEQHQKEQQKKLEQAQKLAVPPQRLNELQGAEADLKLIIKRMSRSKLASIFRFKKEFRELERKYAK